MPGDVAAVGWHVDAGHRWRHAVDGVGLAGQATGHRVVDRIDDAGTAAVQGQGDVARTAEVVDHHGVGMPVHLGDTGQGAGDGSTKGDVKVACIDAADILAEGHGVADRAAVGRRAARADDAGDARRHGIHHHLGGAADAVQGQVQVVAGRILDAATIEIEAAGDADAIGIVVTGLDGVLKDQGRATAAAGHEGGVAGGAADIHGQAWRTAGEHGFAGIDGEAQHVAGLVAAVGRHDDVSHRWHHAIHQDAAGGRCDEAGGAVVAGHVADAAAIELDVARNPDAVGVQLAAGDGQAKHQGAAAGAGQVVGIHGAAGVQGHRQAWGAAGAIDRHRLAEVDGEVQVLPYSVHAIRRQTNMVHIRRHSVQDIGLR